MQWAHRCCAAMLAAGGGTTAERAAIRPAAEMRTRKRLASSVRARPVSTAAMHAISRHQDRAEHSLGLIAPRSGRGRYAPSLIGCFSLTAMLTSCRQRRYGS